MTEPSEEQPDPRTIVRPEPYPSGGQQDDTQSPFGNHPETPADDSATNKRNERKNETK